MSGTHLEAPAGHTRLLGRRSPRLRLWTRWVSVLSALAFFSSALVSPAYAEPRPTSVSPQVPALDPSPATEVTPLTANQVTVRPAPPPEELKLARERVSGLKGRVGRVEAQVRAASVRAAVARAEADRAQAEAVRAAQVAQEAEQEALEAARIAVYTQEQVDRWAVAAYQTGAGPLWPLEALASGSLEVLAHVVGLTDSVADYQAWLLDQAVKARQAAEAASLQAQAAQWAADEALSESVEALQRAEEAFASAAALLERLKEELAAARVEAQELEEELAVQLALAAPLILNIPVSGSLLERASALKDMRPFAPGSGANSTERMPEWERWDATVEPGTARAYAVSQLSKYGWNLAQWPCLDRMWWHESGWRITSYDAMQGEGFSPSRTWGIPQANPASKMANPDQNGGPDWATNPVTQVNWGLWYIKEYYDSPCGAWEAWRARAATGSYGWY